MSNFHLQEIETLQNSLREREEYVTELENRLRALWDKYDGDRKHYMDRIKRLEKELTDTKRKQSVLVSDVVLYEDRGERIKQMEEVGDEMLNWLTDDGISVENLRLIANAWNKAKEDKL